MSKLQAEIKKQHPFESPAQEAYLNLLRTGSVLSAEFDRRFKEAGISAPKYNVLRILRGVGDNGLPSLDIAPRMITRVPDVTRIVDRLIAQGYVQRHQVREDRRVKMVRITPKGQELLARLDGPITALHHKQLSHLSSEELTELSRLLEKARSSGD